MSALEPNPSRSTAYYAERASLTCFLNSLLREWDDWTKVPCPPELDSPAPWAIRIPIAGATLYAPVTFYSSLGRHTFAYPASVEQDGVYHSLSFEEFASRLVGHLQLGSDAAKAVFLGRVRESKLVLTEVLDARREELQDTAHFPEGFVAGEQYLVIGHSFHPNPKSREGFSEDERKRYGPEYAGRFPLAWFAVHRSILHDGTSAAFAGRDWVEELMASDASLRDLQKEWSGTEFKLLPMNPWQARYLQNLPRFAAQIAAGLIKALGEHGEDWFPTSSVRAIARPESPFMIKTSLNVKLTNSIRSLMVREVERGLQVHEVFATAHGQRLLEEQPNFHVLYEPAYRCVRDSRGEIIEESIAIARENPFASIQDETPVVLASLTQDSPFAEDTLIARSIKTYGHAHRLDAKAAARIWFERYLDVVLEPLFMAQAQYGILLGAHQQNIVVGLKDSLPRSLYFRDCQGTGYSEFAYEILKRDVPSMALENGNILPGDKALVLFVYYLVINATFNVVTTLAKATGEEDAVYLEQLRRKIRELRARDPRDPLCLDHLLHSPELMHKGNFLCSITGLNENTSENPFAIYRAIKNPLYTQRQGDNL